MTHTTNQKTEHDTHNQSETEHDTHTTNQTSEHDTPQPIRNRT